MTRRTFLKWLTGFIGMLANFSYWFVREKPEKQMTQWVFDEKNGLTFAPNRKYHKVYLPQVQRGP